MALLDRVGTLIRANLNDLVDRAEDPEKMIKQVILDMQNQLLQVKTQVAISIADQHVLEKKLAENEENERQWLKRAESGRGQTRRHAGTRRGRTFHELQIHGRELPPTGGRSDRAGGTT